MSDDVALQARVMEELAWDPAVDPARIGVAARHGVVTLSGIVESFAVKAAAERAAGRVRGVRAIATEIEVRLPADHHRADAEIADRALRLLEWDVEVPHERIRLRVEHGLVTLTGEVGYHFQRAAAEADLRRLGGVRGVTNLIRVVPAEAPAVEPDLVRRQIEAALRRNAEIEAGGISVEIIAGRAILRGRVETWTERALAEIAALAAPGVTEVENALEVAP